MLFEKNCKTKNCVPAEMLETSKRNELKSGSSVLNLSHSCKNATCFKNKK